MDLTLLATNAVALLSPYLARAAETAATKVGEMAAEGGGKLLAWMKGRLSGQSRVVEALQDLTQQPTDADSQASLRVGLRKALEAQPELVEELAALLKELGAEKLVGNQLQSVSGDYNKVVQAAGKNFHVNIS